MFVIVPRMQQKYDQRFMFEGRGWKVSNERSYSLAILMIKMREKNISRQRFLCQTMYQIRIFIFQNINYNDSR